MFHRSRLRRRAGNLLQEVEFFADALQLGIVGDLEAEEPLAARERLELAPQIVEVQLTDVQSITRLARSQPRHHRASATVPFIQFIPRCVHIITIARFNFNDSGKPLYFASLFLPLFVSFYSKHFLRGLYAITIAASIQERRERKATAWCLSVPCLSDTPVELNYQEAAPTRPANVSALFSESDTLVFHFEICRYCNTTPIHQASLKSTALINKTAHAQNCW